MTISQARAALCADCRTTWRYCPRCEAVYPIGQTSQRTVANGRSSAYCLPCGNAVRRKGGVPWHAYAAAQHARKHPQLAAIIKLYRAGATYRAIAQQIEMNPGTLRALIYQAKRRGQWPKQLKRRAL